MQGIWHLANHYNMINATQGNSINITQTNKQTMQLRCNATILNFISINAHVRVHPRLLAVLIFLYSPFVQIWTPSP